MHSYINKTEKLVPCCTYIKMREDNDFLIVINENLQIEHLSQVAKDFYMNVDGTKTIEEINQLLVQEYDVDYSVLQNDMLIFVKDLQWKKLITLKEKI
ncbi:MAG: hypothetical protein ATN35_09710 [Epulopiscium sp. Nele67-Bin004]|nr:MAG: hypothetical protein ATN35_09710 [Epulopiscium sp. Nele67-Bin004]